MALTAVSARMPEGGMFVMVDVRATKLSGEEFAWKLLDDHNIGVMPGESFGKGGAGHVRIALTVEAASTAPSVRNHTHNGRSLSSESKITS